MKEAFNAIIQTTKPLRNYPSKINIDYIGMSWAELRERVQVAHKPIDHLFLTGLGNQLQF